MTRLPWCSRHGSNQRKKTEFRNMRLTMYCIIANNRITFKFALALSATKMTMLTVNHRDKITAKNVSKRFPAETKSSNAAIRVAAIVTAVVSATSRGGTKNTSCTSSSSTCTSPVCTKQCLHTLRRFAFESLCLSVKIFVCASSSETCVWTRSLSSRQG